MTKDNSNIQPITTASEATIDLKAYGEWRDQLVHQIRQMRFRAAMQLNARRPSYARLSTLRQ